MRVSQRSGLFSGVAFLACATVLLELALTRLHAALFGPHVAHVALAVSLLGAGTGGVLLYVAPSIARPPSLFASLASLSALASGAVLVALILAMELRPLAEPGPRAMLWLVLVYTVSALPFVLTGAAIAAAIRHAAPDMPRLYLVALAGAAVGGLVAVAALRTGAPRAVLVAAILFAAAAVLFYIGSRVTPGERRAHGGLIATFVLGSSVLLAGDLGTPWLKLSTVRWMQIEKTELQAWTEQSLVTVDRPKSGAAWIRVNGVAASPLYDAKTTPPAHPEEMAYALHGKEGPVLVLGAGGGREIRAALKAGQTEVHAVEPDRTVVERVMRGRYAEFSGYLFDKPEVHVALIDGRSFVRRRDIAFHNIVVAYPDTTSASAAGALALFESRLYTVEGVGDLLSRLKPEGTLMMSRSSTELDRLLALTAAGLRRVGAATPKQHLFACGASPSITLLVKRTPLTPGEIDKLRRHCRKSRFSEAFAPDRPDNPLRERLVAGAGASAAAPDTPVDLSPPTDDRPFFFYSVPAHRLLAVLRDLGTLKAQQASLFALSSLLVASLLLGALGLLVPLALNRRARGALRGGAAPSATEGSLRGPPRARPVFFFAALGAGFALLELAVVQRVVGPLGDVGYAAPLSVVVLLASAGVGSLLTARVTPAAAGGAAAFCAELLVVCFALAAIGLGPLLTWSLGLSPIVHFAVTAAVLMPLGVLAGALAPLGVKLLATTSPDLIPWCWGLGAVASAMAMACGLLLALNLGYSALSLGAGLAYLIVAATVPPHAAGGAAAPGGASHAVELAPAPALPPDNAAPGALPQLSVAAHGA